MAYAPYKTFVSGYNTEEQNPHRYIGLSGDAFAKVFEASEAWMAEHFVQLRRVGICKPETVRKMAERAGIVRGLTAEAVSFDQSGKARHHTRPIDL